KSCGAAGTNNADYRIDAVFVVSEHAEEAGNESGVIVSCAEGFHKRFACKFILISAGFDESFIVPSHTSMRIVSWDVLNGFEQEVVCFVFVFEVMGDMGPHIPSSRVNGFKFYSAVECGISVG